MILLLNMERLKMPESNKIRTRVCEQETEEHPDDEVAVVIDYYEQGQQLWIDIVDDRFTHGQGVLLEVWQGELRALVWTDPESEDPTHTIPIMPLSSASESFQKEYADAISD